jgi:hypothetical protein
VEIAILTLQQAEPSLLYFRKDGLNALLTNLPILLIQADTFKISTKQAPQAELIKINSKTYRS